MASKSAKSKNVPLPTAESLDPRYSLSLRQFVFQKVDLFHRRWVDAVQHGEGEAHPIAQREERKHACQEACAFAVHFGNSIREGAGYFFRYIHAKLYTRVISSIPQDDDMNFFHHVL